MIRTETIDGPLGPFLIPAEPPETRRICAGLSRGVWGSPGRYDLPDAGVPEYEAASLTMPGIRHILDIGAGWGAFTVWALKRWADLGGDPIEIDCYEPNPDAIEFIGANAAAAQANLFSHSVVRVHDLAVTASAIAILSRSEDWGARRVMGSNEGDAVQAIAPSRLPPCDIIKCDAEGAEPDVFANYPHLRSVKAAIYEWHTPADRVEVAEYCKRAGLRCVRDEDGPWGPGNGVAVWVRS